ncbi:MAG: hypothetical protein C4576_20985 [Desulfobacteraceae bacterium]|nr:MAG: hypothetical protein C4576_20985 [Desulfobacteraceae bacterium]
MGKLMAFSNRHPVLVALILLAVSILAGFQLPTVSLDPSLEGLTIENDPQRKVYEETTALFGSDKINIVYVHDRDLFTPEKLGRLESLAIALESIPGVKTVESIFTANNFKKESGMLVSGPLMEWVPESLEEAAQILADGRENPIIEGNLVSGDGRSMAINMYIDEERSDPAFYRKMSQSVSAAIAPLSPHFEKIFQIGTPYLRYRVSEMMIADQKHIIPLSIGVLFAAFIITTFSVAGVALPFLTSAVSILWTLGFMGMVSIPINILTFIVPSLVIVVGSTEDIHLISQYNEGVGETGDRKSAIQWMISRSGTVILVTALTTFLGFLSICVSDITILVQFGVASSFGLFVNPLITCVTAPIYFRLFGTKHEKIGPAEAPVRDAFGPVLGWLIRLLETRKKEMLFGFVAITVLLGGMAYRVRLENDVVSLFRKDSDVVRRVDALGEELPGIQSFFIRISGGHPDIFKEPANLAEIAAVQEFIRKQSDFDKSVSLVDFIALIHREMEGSGAAVALPETRQRVSQYLTFLTDNDISRYVNHDFSEVNILVRHNLNSSFRQKEALERLKTFVQGTLNPHFKAAFVGDAILALNAADAVAGGQAKSIGLLLLIIFIIMSIIFLNAKAGLLALIPNVIPVAINFGIMGLFGIPLNVGTAMVAVIAIGIAVDDTLHFMTRYNHEMHTVKDQNIAMRIVVRSEFRAAFSTSVALSLGFLVLIFSNFMVIVQFGILSAVVMLVAFISDVVVTPILMSNTRLLTLWDMLSLQLKKEVIEQSEFFRDMRVWQIKKVVLLSRVREAGAGEMIYREGNPADSMFLLLDGQVRQYGLQSGTQKEVAHGFYSSGDVFGIMGMLENWDRPDNVRAESDVRYVEISRESLQRLHNLYPHISSKVYRNLARILGGQLTVGQLVLSERGASASFG